MSERTIGTRDVSDCACRICGKCRGNKLHQAREMLFGMRDTFTYVECASCGTIQISSVPDLVPFYPPDYYSFRKPHDTGKDELRLKKRVALYLGELARKRAAGSYLRNKTEVVKNRGFLGNLFLKHWERVVFGFPPYLIDTGLNLNITSKSAILDFGSGGGLTLETLGHFGFADLTGVDPFIEAPITLGKRGRVLKATLSDLSNEFDLILANHSVEHVPNPISTLREMHRLLRSGHYAIIRIPVISYAWRRYGVNWVQLDPPRHLFLFKPHVFSGLACEVGFRVDQIRYDSNAFQFWGSEQYVQDIPMLDERSYFVDPDESIFSPEQIEAFETQAAKLNDCGDGDQAVFYLYKCE